MDKQLFKVRVSTTYRHVISNTGSWEFYWYGLPVHMDYFGVFYIPKPGLSYTCLSREPYIEFLYPERKAAMDRINKLFYGE